jgi:glycosyltransferase involved in cell wall biosynthesis
LWAGSGLKIKLVEALAHGKAIVATPLAAEGLEDGAHRAFLVAQRPSDLVHEISSLLANPSRREALERAALDYAATALDPQRVWQELDEVLADHTRHTCASRTPLAVSSEVKLCA